MAGTDTFRGIAYQQAHAIHFVVDLVEQFPDHQLRIEGADDVIDIEVFDANEQLVQAHQVKSRTARAWTPKPIAEVLVRWAALNEPAADFTFITDGELGPGAQDLAAALQIEGPTRTQAVANALGSDTTVAARLKKARIRVDPSPTGALLDSAQRRIASMLDPLDNDRDATAQARVNALFTALTQRAALPEPADRLITAQELRDLIRGDFGVRAEHQWPGALKDRFIAAVQPIPGLVPITINKINGPSSLPLDTLLARDTSVLSGATGTGKSSVIDVLQSTTATAGQALIVCRAEIYTPGRLEALVADAVSFVTGSPVPTRAGRHALADPDAVVVIDGVTEVPDPISDALVDELAALTARPVRARIVVVGRDDVVLRRAVHRAPSANTYVVSPLPQDAQEEIVRKVLESPPSPSAMFQILRGAEKALHDGARNPMLFTIYLEASRDASDVMSRVDVYERFVSRLSAKSATVGYREHLSALGVVFARLLGEQRRYSNRHEWVELTDSVSPTADGGELRAAAVRIGLVTDLGLTGTVAPFHDSLADYLAAVAVAAGDASLPDTLHETHAEWVTFASELGVDVSMQVSRDLPFHTLRVAESDEHVADRSTFDQRTTVLLSALLGTDDLTVTATEELDGRWSLRAFDAAGKSLGRAAVEENRGPLYAAARLWRLILRARLNQVRRGSTPIPMSVEEAHSFIVQFVRQRRDHLDDMLRTFPAAQRSRLLKQLRPLGVSFHVDASTEQPGAADLSMTYQRSDATRALPVAPDYHASHTVVSYFLDGGPRWAAVANLRNAVERLVDRTGWLS